MTRSSALAFADTYRMLNNSIGIFTSLPLESLDSLSLQRRLDDIGKTKTDTRRKPERAQYSCSQRLGAEFLGRPFCSPP